MNRSLTSVILGGFGNKPVKTNKQESIAGTHIETSVDQVADLMINSQNIIITPGEIKRTLINISYVVGIIILIFFHSASQVFYFS